MPELPEQPGPLICESPGGYPPGAAWPMWRGCPSRAGRASLVGPTEGAILWELRTEGHNLKTPIVDQRGIAYFANYEALTAVAGDGLALWTLEGDQPEAWGIAGALTSSGRAFFVMGGQLFSVDSEGQRESHATVGDRWHAVAPLVTPGGDVIVTGKLPVTVNQGLMAFDSSGSLRWSLELGSSELGDPAMGPDGTLYVSGAPNLLFAVTAEGTLKWTFDTGSGIRSPSVGSDGSVYVGSHDRDTGTGQLLAISPEGSERWRFETGYPVSGPPVISADGTLSVLGGGQLHALTPQGELKWSVPIESSTFILADAIVDVRGTVYVASNTLIAISSSGARLFETVIQPDALVDWRNFAGGLALGADGTLYVGASGVPGGSVYAFRDQSSW